MLPSRRSQSEKRYSMNTDQMINRGIFFYVLYSTLLHLSPLRFHCVGGCWDRNQHPPNYTPPENIEWFIEGQAFSRLYCIIRLLTHPLPPPSPGSKLDRRHRGRLRKRDKLVTGGGGARSRIIPPQEILVLRKSFKTIWCPLKKLSLLQVLYLDQRGSISFSSPWSWFRIAWVIRYQKTRNRTGFNGKIRSQKSWPALSLWRYCLMAQEGVESGINRSTLMNCLVGKCPFSALKGHHQAKLGTKTLIR